MQFTVTINQVKALEWGLNSQQALLFAFVYGCPSWAKATKTDDGIYFVLSKAKIVEELPLLTDKPDTAYRMLKVRSSELVPALQPRGPADTAGTTLAGRGRIARRPCRRRHLACAGGWRLCLP